MKIYIDESGIFSNPNDQPHAVSCIASLTLPDAEDEIFREFSDLSTTWTLDADEVKGSRLNEDQIASTIAILKEYPVVLEICAIDLGIHTNKEIESHKLLQGQRLVKNINEGFHPRLVEQLHEMKARIVSMSNPLYVQFIALTNLVNMTLRSTMLYYSHASPQSLGDYHWYIDAKDKEHTDYENIWLTLVPGFLQSESLNNPITQMDEGDYSAFSKNESQSVLVPNHLKEFAQRDVKRSGAFDLKKVLSKNLQFISSKESIGLQLVDILVNAVRRAFKGNLKIDGWRDIGCLMLKKFHGAHSIQLITLKPDTRLVFLTSTLPYYQVIKVADSQVRSQLPATNSQDIP